MNNLASTFKLQWPNEEVICLLGGNSTCGNKAWHLASNVRSWVGKYLLTRLVTYGYSHISENSLQPEATL